MMDVLPIFPTPVGVISVRSYAKPTALSTNPSRPKQALGGGGGGSLGTLDTHVSAPDNSTTGSLTCFDSERW